MNIRGEKGLVNKGQKGHGHTIRRLLILHNKLNFKCLTLSAVESLKCTVVIDGVDFLIVINNIINDVINQDAENIFDLCCKIVPLWSRTKICMLGRSSSSFEFEDVVSVESGIVVTGHVGCYLKQ